MRLRTWRHDRAVNVCICTLGLCVNGTAATEVYTLSLHAALRIGGGMADLAQELTLELNIPVIDGVSAAVKMVESLAALRLTTSKHGDLNYPLEKPLSGRFAGLNLREHYV